MHLLIPLRSTPEYRELNEINRRDRQAARTNNSYDGRDSPDTTYADIPAQHGTETAGLRCLCWAANGHSITFGKRVPRSMVRVEHPWRPRFFWKPVLCAYKMPTAAYRSLSVAVTGRSTPERRQCWAGDKLGTVLAEILEPLPGLEHEVMRKAAALRLVKFSTAMTWLWHSHTLFLARVLRE